MSDIFISYARSTVGEAELVAEALRASGYRVWRDDEIPAHSAYSDVIEQHLRTAKAVLVLWSADAAKSQWVRSEAEHAREARKLVQLVLDETPLPMPFDQIECANLKGWSGDLEAAGWRKVLSSVADLVATGPSGPSAAAEPLLRNLAICVLPFSNMSGEAEQEYFSDGITEDIITDLSKVSALSVVARNTAFTFKGKAVDVGKVARQLNVSHVLEGSVRKAGSRVRITAQLIDGAAGDHVWAERYDRDLSDIFALQDEISQAIVAALRLKLLPKEKEAITQRGTTSSEAYNYYLMARRYYLSGNNMGGRRAEAIIRLCRRATEVDPNYALAWALMATGQSILHYSYGQEDTGADAAERALTIDPNLAEAHAVKARCLAERGLHDEADAEIQLALDLDPESYEVNLCAGTLNYRRGLLSAATRYFEKAAALMETEFDAIALVISTSAALGDAEGVRRAANVTFERTKAALERDPDNLVTISYGAYALAALGDGARAREWIDRALLIDPGNQNIRYNFACAVCVYLHDVDAALDLLGPFFATAAAGILGHARGDPDLAAVREDPRFLAMLKAADERLAANG